MRSGSRKQEESSSDRIKKRGVHLEWGGIPHALSKATKRVRLPPPEKEKGLVRGYLRAGKPGRKKKAIALPWGGKTAPKPLREKRHNGIKKGGGASSSFGGALPPLCRGWKEQSPKK